MAGAVSPRIGGLGHLSEIADADPPFEPKGCPFQAWSLGELLRLDRVVLVDPKTAPRGYPIPHHRQEWPKNALGVVDTESDKTLAAARASEVTGEFGIENDLLVEKNQTHAPTIA